MNQKKRFICKIYPQEDTGKDVLVSADTDMGAYSFPKRDSIKYPFL